VSGGRRVALLTPCFWPEVRRGGERLLRDLADGLLAHGHSPRLLTSHPGPPGRAVEDGLEVVRSRRPPEGGLVRRGLLPYLTHVPLTWRELTRGEDELAHAVYASDALAALAWRRSTGNPVVFQYNGIPVHADLTRRRLQLELTEAAATGADAVVGVSRTAADAFGRWLGVDAEVIHPAVNLERFSPSGPRSEAPTIFCAADTDVPRKGAALLVRAFAGVRRERPDARLLLMRPAEPAAAARLEEVPGVGLVDFVERPEDLAPVYSGAWVTALPSTGEAFGMVLVESMACGTPVVGTDDSAIPEIVASEDHGFLFPREDAAGLESALLRALELAESPGTPEACRARAAEFSTGRMTERYLELYSRLL
jgi:phosphatidylinositol alpha-mannosyltransferase